ncbi:hypothetical protein Esti_004669 [Eimeria stiedai]
MWFELKGSRRLLIAHCLALLTAGPASLANAAAAAAAAATRQHHQDKGGQSFAAANPAAAAEAAEAAAGAAEAAAEAAATYSSRGSLGGSSSRSNSRSSKLQQEQAFVNDPSSIRWDEAVIEEHNLLRGTRAPITEPKTPYNQERVDEEEDEQVGYSSCSSNTSSSSSRECMGLWLLQPSPIDPAELASRLAMLQEDSDSQQQQQQQQDFKEKRRKHYNEFVESKLRLQTLAEKEDDEDEEGQDN